MKSNFEFTSQTALTAKGLETFLPTYRTRRQWSDRVKEIDAPLFSGYLFSRFDAACRLPVLSAPGVVSIVSAGKTLLPVEERELEAVRAVLNSPVCAGPWPFLQVGQQVELVRGPLTGLEGLVVKIKNQFRLVVSVSLLQRSLAAEIESDWIRPKSVRSVTYGNLSIPA